MSVLYREGIIGKGTFTGGTYGITPLFVCRSSGKGGLFRLPGGVEERHLLQSREHLRKKHDMVAGFVRASAPLPPRLFPPPKVPPDFRPHHVFPAESSQGTPRFLDPA
jgi:hypothetical protein